MDDREGVDTVKRSVAARARVTANGWDERAVRRRLREWIAARSGRGTTFPLTDQTRILEVGLVSSLDTVEMVLFIEELRGEEVDPGEIEPEFFTSVDALWEGFFAGQGRER